MKISQWMQIILVGGCVLTMTGCHTAKKNTDNDAVNEANSAYSQAESNDAQTMAAGNESQINEQSQQTKSSSRLAKRTYYFNFDSNVVHNSDKPAILSNADYLVAHPKYKIMLEGHTDPRGSREYNIGLGERRAKAVAAILTSRGVSPSQIRIVSYGAEKLAVAGRSESDYQLDRRVNLVLIQR